MPPVCLGVIFHWLGGLASGSFYVPYKAVKKWSWEVYWLAGGFFSWMAKNWKGFVLTIAVLALIADLVVYLLRWRPYRVWISFFRRLSQPARPSDPEVYWERRVQTPVPEPWPAEEACQTINVWSTGLGPDKKKPVTAAKKSQNKAHMKPVQQKLNFKKAA